MDSNNLTSQTYFAKWLWLARLGIKEVEIVYIALIWYFDGQVLPTYTLDRKVICYQLIKAFGAGLAGPVAIEPIAVPQTSM